MKNALLRYFIWTGFIAAICFSIFVFIHTPVGAPKQLSARVIAEEQTQFLRYKLIEIDAHFYLAQNIPLPLGSTFFFRELKIKRVFGFEDSFERYWRGRNIQAEITIISPYSYKCDLYCVIIQDRSSIRQWFTDKWVHTLCNTEQQAKCQDKVMLAQGLTIGGDISFSEHIKQILIEQNLYHIVVVSGFQIAIIAITLERLATYLKIPIIPRYFLIITLLIVYGYVTGFEPPVVRSLIALGISSGILIFLGRKVSDFLILFYTVVISLLLSPFLIFSPSWQLSIIATISILIIEHYARNWRWWLKILVTTIFTFILTAPITAQFNNNVSLVSLLVNLIILPIIPILTLLYLITLIPLLGSIIGIPVGLVTDTFLYFLNESTRISHYYKLSFSLNMFSAVELLYYYLGFFVFFTAYNFLRRRLTKIRFWKKV